MGKRRYECRNLMGKAEGKKSTWETQSQMLGQYENGSERDQIGGVIWIVLMIPALFWDITQGQSSYFLTLEVGTDSLSRNVGMELPLQAA